jgi:hypothetical protein
VVDCQRSRAYHLEDSKGKLLHRPWNDEHLKKYFINFKLFVRFVFDSIKNFSEVTQHSKSQIQPISLLASTKEFKG